MIASVVDGAGLGVQAAEGVGVGRVAREIAPRRINAVSPGLIETGWWDVLPEDARQATFDQFANQTPVGRNGTAEDVAHAICAVVGNDYINGVVLPCDGGLRLT